ncbi:MAG: SDR family NAD(P)-dependent oxidoreductase, partial [Gaiellaceae bacterium]
AEAALDEVLDVNVKAVFLLTASIAPPMAQRRRGAIINVTTMAAEFVFADLASAEHVRDLGRRAADVDILVNNAGVSPGGATHELEEAALDEVLDVNVKAVFLLTAAIAPRMAQRRTGTIINVSTMAAELGIPGLSAYGASKAAVDLLTKAWAAEYGPHGVRVNAVAPGPTNTPGTAAMGEVVRILVEV